MNPPALISVLLVALLGLLLTGPAAAADSIYADCADGRLDGDYSPSQIRDARQAIPTDVDEYTDCRDVLTAALDDALDEHRNAGGARDGGEAGGPAPKSGGGREAAPTDGAGAAGAGTGGADAEPAPERANSAPRELLTPATQREQSVLDRARRSPQSVRLGGEILETGTAGAPALTVRRQIPGPLVVVLILLGALVAAIAAPALRTHVRHRRRRP